MKYNREEKNIVLAFENETMKLSKPSAKEIEAIKRAAVNTFTKDKRVTIRLSAHDFRGIQKKAMEIGIPYQILISGIIHQYIEGDLKTKD